MEPELIVLRSDPMREVDTFDGWHPDLEEVAAFCR